MAIDEVYKRTCGRCKGSGKDPDHGDRCDSCNGKGVVYITKPKRKRRRTF